MTSAAGDLVRAFSDVEAMSSGARYENEYTLFARTAEGLIVEVHEGLDTLKVVRDAETTTERT